MSVKIARNFISLWFWMREKKWFFVIPMLVIAYLMVGGATASYIEHRENCGVFEDKFDRRICEIKNQPKILAGTLGWPIYWPIHAGYNIIN